LTFSGACRTGYLWYDFIEKRFLKNPLSSVYVTLMTDSNSNEYWMKRTILLYGLTLAVVKEGGATEAELQTAKDKWKDFGELYKNPIIRFGMTLTEILPIGLLISLLSAFLLRKKGPLPTNTNKE
jgi:hypothetical protein